MADDIEVVLSPAIAGRIKKMLEWFERQFRNTPQRKAPHFRTAPDLRVGKAAANIAMLATGQVDIWTGAPGSEVKLALISSPYCFNLTPQTLTKGKWCVIVDDYIVASIQTARIIKVTLTADLTVGGSSSNPTVDSFYDGEDPAKLSGTLKIYSSWVQSVTIKSGKKVLAIWNDVLQQYEALDWSC